MKTQLHLKQLLQPKNAINAVAANNATLECDGADYSAQYNEKYTVYTDLESGAKEGYFDMPAGKADKDNNAYNESAYAFTLTSEEVEVENPEDPENPLTETKYTFEVGDDEGSSLADDPYARLDYLFGINNRLVSSVGLKAESFWTPIHYGVDDETGEIEFSYGQFNTGFGNGLLTSTMVLIMVFGLHVMLYLVWSMQD